METIRKDLEFADLTNDTILDKALQFNMIHASDPTLRKRLWVFCCWITVPVIRVFRM